MSRPLTSAASFLITLGQKNLLREPDSTLSTHDQTKLPHTCLVYIPVKDPGLIETLGFYRLDVAALSDVFDSVVVETKLWRALRSNADVAYVWWWTRSLPFLIGWKLKRRPCVTTGATDFRLPGVSRTWRAARIVTTAFGGWLSDANIAISAFEARDLALVRARNRIIIAPAVQNEELLPDRTSQKPSGAIVAQMNPGSIQRKGVELTLRALPHILATLPEFHLHLIGPISASGQNVLSALTYGIPEDRFTLHGLLSEPEKLSILKSAWVYFQPSSYEGFGLALAEAIACGAYPISTGNTATVELLEGICQPVHPEATAVAFEAIRAIQSSTLHRSDVRAARSALMNRFSLESKKSRLRAVFSEIL